MAFPTSGTLPAEQQYISTAGFQSAAKALFPAGKAPLILLSVPKGWSKLIL